MISVHLSYKDIDWTLVKIIEGCFPENHDYSFKNARWDPIKTEGNFNLIQDETFPTAVYLDVMNLGRMIIDKNLNKVLINLPVIYLFSIFLIFDIIFSI